MKKVLGLKTLSFLLSVLFAFGAWAKFKDHTWVRGEGEVTRLLEDDLEPPCHQRFIIKDSRDKTLLIVNNIDSWPRLDGVKVGDLVEFRGEFIQNEKGGLVHWTHPDPSGRKKGGFVKIKKSAPETPQEPEEEVLLKANVLSNDFNALRIAFPPSTLECGSYRLLVKCRGGSGRPLVTTTRKVELVG